MIKKVREVIAILEMNGWRFVCGRGDHKIYKKDGYIRSVTVPGKMSEDVQKPLYHSILKQAGLDNLINNR